MNAKTPKQAALSSLGFPDPLPNEHRVRTWTSLELRGREVLHAKTCDELRSKGYSYNARTDPDRPGYMLYTIYVIAEIGNLGVYEPA